MVSDIKQKLATITLLAMTLVALSIPVMAAYYQNDDGTAVNECSAATLEGDDVCQVPAVAEDVELTDVQCEDIEDACEATDASESECDVPSDGDASDGDDAEVFDEGCTYLADEASIENVSDDTAVVTDEEQSDCTDVTDTDCSDTVTVDDDAASDVCTPTPTAICNGSKTCTYTKVCNGSKATTTVCNGSKAYTCPKSTAS